jgi:hypothetical protein
MSRFASIVALVSTLLLGVAALADEIENSEVGDPAPSAERAVEDGFETVDPASLETVSGACLTIAAYAIITGALAFYCLVLMLRERGVYRAIRRLDQRLDRQPK